jgi:cholesterol transport system auxiliary component
MRLAATALAVALLLSGCGAVPVPDMTWYRLPEPVLPPARAARVEVPIDVAVFSADGLYADQALIYALDAEGHALRTYHYQQWSDPPSRMLQRRLIRVLREIDAAPQVTDRLPASANALRVSAVIQRYERVEDAGRFRVEVALQIRVEYKGRVLAEDEYAARVEAAGTDIPATVAAYGTALDQINASFIARLASLGRELGT